MIQGDSDYAAHERTFLAWLRTGIAGVVTSLGNLNDLETIAPFLAASCRMFEPPTGGISMQHNTSAVVLPQR